MQAPKLRVPIRPHELRSPERLFAHYVIESRLRERLLTAPKDLRGKLYSSVYDELFRSVPDHPQLTRKAEPEANLRHLNSTIKPLRAFLTPQTSLLEFGCGDGAFACAVAKYVRAVFAVDASSVISTQVDRPDNVHRIVSDGLPFPFPDGSVNVVYSNQVMEHLHLDDVAESLAEVFRILSPGGLYICVTPNRLSGPHDISRYFDNVARGLHLKEYSATELVCIFRKGGFRKVQVFDGPYDGKSFPFWRVLLTEGFLQLLPTAQRMKLADQAPNGFLNDIMTVAVK